MIYFGKEASMVLHKNLREDADIRCKGYFKENHLWIAFDNRNGHCYVEEFQKEELAVFWLEDYYEMSEVENFKVKRLFSNLYLLEAGFLKINYNKKTADSKFYPFSIRFFIKKAYI